MQWKCLILTKLIRICQLQSTLRLLIALYMIAKASRVLLSVLEALNKRSKIEA